jgi:hypothetical protein
VAVANEAVVKRVNYFLERSQNDEYLSHRSVTKRSCGCTLIFHFDNVSISLTAHTIQNTLNNLTGIGHGTMVLTERLHFFIFHLPKEEQRP